MPLRMDGTVKTTRFAPKDDQDARWEATMIWPDAAAQVGSKADLQTQLEATLGQEGPGEKVAYVRFSTAAGETRDCGVFIGYNKDEERRQTPSEAVKGWMTRSHDGQKIDDYFAEANAVEVIPGTRLQMGAATANGVETNFLEQMGKRKFAIGSSKVTVAEIPASKRLDAPSGQPDERPSDRQMDYIKAISTNRGRKIPDEVERSQLAASAWIGQNQVSLGWQRGQIICRPDYKDKNGNMFALAIGVCHERRAGMPLAAVPTPAAPNAPQFAAEAAREIARERDSILTGEARVLEERRQDQQVDTRVETGKASELEPPASHDDLEEDAGMRPGG
ncbi:MAG: hypothetical protein OXE84_07800 [Rhodobacteraceae bacterium]|nr:hypothetical protein [Paracoccaceae bacterium]